MKRILLWYVMACAAFFSGCGQRDEPSVERLAAALRAHGVSYDVSETAALTGIRGEGLRLTGRGLAVDLYCIEDEAERQALVSAAERLAAAPAQDANAPALKCYVRKPFVVIVRREPEEGQVAAALSAALPE
jgi:hypothetical protein